MGPEALRVAKIGPVIESLGHPVKDCGNLTGPPNPEAPPVNSYRHLPEVADWNRRVHEAAWQELAAGRLPVLLGGDHSLALGSISAVARHCRQHGKRLRIHWLDSHADFNTAELTPTGNLHGMPVACLCGHGPRELVEIGGTVPAINPRDVRQVGIRCVDEGEKPRVHELGIDPNTHLHVSLDVDFADPSIAPGVGTTIRGGPGYREAQLAMEMIHGCGAMASLDVVELNPALDVRNQTAELAVRLVASLFGKTTLMRVEWLKHVES